MSEKNTSEINIIYDIKEENKINIFGFEFVRNNKKICKMIINNQEYEIREQYNICNKNTKLKIKLKGIDKVINMSNMFDGCSSLSSLPDFSNWNTDKVTNMCSMFRGCSSLSSLPDISNWNTDKVTNMSYMFYECSSLLSLPDISNWNTTNVTKMSFMFYRCSSLSSLPDISNWNTEENTDMRAMFD